MRQLLILASLIASACSGPVETAQAEGEGSAAFGVTGDDMQVGLLGLGYPWKGEPIRDTRRQDAFGGGEARTMQYGNGLVSIFTRADGHVWRVRLQTGIGDRCGAQRDLDAGLTALRSMLADADARVSTSAGCLPTATVTA